MIGEMILLGIMSAGSLLELEQILLLIQLMELIGLGYRQAQVYFQMVWVFVGMENDG